MEASIHQEEPDDIDLYATALARDLVYATATDAAELLELASSDAVAAIDASDLDASEFAEALRRLAAIRAGVEKRLFGTTISSGPHMPARH